VPSKCRPSYLLIPRETPGGVKKGLFFRVIPMYQAPLLLACPIPLRFWSSAEK